ncbi:hypothetical protein V6N13_037425 [Hibiscus sabdariffa]
MPQRQNNIMLGNNLNTIPQRTQSNSYADTRNNQETLAKYKDKNDITIQNLTTSVQNLEIQIGQIASALNSRSQGTLPSNTEDSIQTRNEQCKLVTLQSGRQCEVESPAKQAIQRRDKDPVDETPVEPKKAGAESHSTVKKDSANEKVDAKQQPDANKTSVKPAEPTYLTDLVQLCQEMNDASSDSIDKHLEETIKDEQQ